MSENLTSQIADAKCNAIDIYTDGAYFKNHNMGGWGYVMYCNQKPIYQDSGKKKPSGSLEMEIIAAIEAIKSLPKTLPFDASTMDEDEALNQSHTKFSSSKTQITLHTDSRIILEGLFEKFPIWEKNQWQVKSGKTVVCKSLWQELHALSEKYAIKWQWVKAHCGNEGNERSDQLARAAVLNALT